MFTFIVILVGQEICRYSGCRKAFSCGFDGDLRHAIKSKEKSEWWERVKAPDFCLAFFFFFFSVFYLTL